MNIRIENHEKHPSGAKAQIRFVPFAAVRAEALTYQSCPVTKQACICIFPQPIQLRLKPAFLRRSAHSPHKFPKRKQ
jgi:hypothetical protein